MADSKIYNTNLCHFRSDHVSDIGLKKRSEQVCFEKDHIDTFVKTVFWEKPNTVSSAKVDVHRTPSNT